MWRCTSISPYSLYAQHNFSHATIFSPYLINLKYLTFNGRVYDCKSCACHPIAVIYQTFLNVKILYHFHSRVVGQVAQQVQQLAKGWMARGSNPGGGEIFRTCPDRPWEAPNFLYNGYQVFPGRKLRPRRDADPSPPSSTVIKKGQSYTSTPPMGRTTCTEPQCLYKGALLLQSCSEKRIGPCVKCLLVFLSEFNKNLECIGHFREEF